MALAQTGRHKGEGLMLKGVRQQDLHLKVLEKVLGRGATFAFVSTALKDSAGCGRCAGAVGAGPTKAGEAGSLTWGCAQAHL